MENKKFYFNSIKTGMQSAYTLKYIPTDIMLIWAAVIIFNFASKGMIFPLVIFAAGFLALMGFFWANICKPRIEFNSETKRLETRYPCSFYAIKKIDLSKVDSLTSEGLDQTLKDTVKSCLFGLGGGAAAGTVIGLIFGVLVVGIGFGIAGGMLLGALTGLGLGFVVPGSYKIYHLEAPDESMKKTSAGQSKEENSKTNWTVDYYVFIENPDDIEVFESFLKDCWEKCGRRDFVVKQNA